MWCGIMVNPSIVNGGNHHVFMCGNHLPAKNKVRQILKSFGWHESNIIDLGDISKARGTEMYLPLWLSLYGNMQSPAFNIQIVK
jgi:predicted dinucleotide-binding enzyme